MGMGQQRVTHQTSYADGVAKVVFGYSEQDITLEFRKAGAELTVNGKHKFDLSGAKKKTILIKSNGNARASPKPIQPPALAPMMGPMGPMMPFGGGQPPMGRR